MTKLRLASALILCSSISLACLGQETGGTKPDNSKVNQRDRKTGQATADDQKMNAADTELARKIRRSIMTDKSLSTYAQNIKIICRDGMVTMKGPVKSESEKKSLISKAVAITAKAENVKNQISVVE